MALSATLTADFSSFVDATKTSSAALKEFQGTAATTAPALAKVGTASEAASRQGNEFKTAFNQVDKSLAAVGINLGPLPGMLDEMSAALGKTVGELGLLGTAGAVAAAGMAGWQIGTKIGEWTGLTEWISRTTAAAMGWGDVAAQEAAAGSDTLARATALAGREITDMAVALRILGDHAVAASAEQKKLAADLKLSEAAAERFATFTAKLFGYDDINRAEMYRAALGGVQNVTKLTTEAKKELHDAVTDALEAYTALGEKAPPELLKIQAATLEMIPVMKSFSAANSGMWAEFAAGVEDGTKRMAAIAEAAKLTWEDIWEEMGGKSRAELESIAAKAEETFAVAQQHSERFTPAQIANFERVAVEARKAVDSWGTVTLETYDAIASASTETANTQIANATRASAATVTSWHEAMSAVSAGQGTMGGTVGGVIDTGPTARASIQKAYEEGRYYGPVVNVSENNPRGTGPNWAALGFRASGGPVSAGSPYMVGERGPELFIPKASGSISPHGAGGLTVNNVITVSGGTETLARQVASEIMRTIRAGTQLGTA